MYVHAMYEKDGKMTDEEIVIVGHFDGIKVAQVTHTCDCDRTQTLDVHVRNYANKYDF